MAKRAVVGVIIRLELELKRTILVDRRSSLGSEPGEMGEMGEPGEMGEMGGLFAVMMRR